jgi:hypothetical protein
MSVWNEFPMFQRYLPPSSGIDVALNIIEIEKDHVEYFIFVC